jgi:DNA-binding LacI/PurR family transcriptional regulator
VSKATASVALRGDRGVSPETAERVRRAAKELGYVRPQGGAPRRVKVGAVLASAPDPSGESQYYALQLLTGAQDELAREFDSVELQVVSESKVVRAQVATELSGVLFLGGLFDPQLISRISVPSVLVGTYFPQWPFDAVLADNSRGAYLATSALLTQGCRNVALLNGPPTTRTSELKELGYRESLADASIRSPLIESGDFGAESGYLLAKKLLARAPDVDGIVVADDPMAVGALNYLHDAGRKVPEDVAVIGFGDSPAGSMARPALSSVRVFQREMGGLGARILARRVLGEAGPYTKTLIDPELVVRRSSMRNPRTKVRDH